MGKTIVDNYNPHCPIHMKKEQKDGRGQMMTGKKKEECFEKEWKDDYGDIMTDKQKEACFSVSNQNSLQDNFSKIFPKKLKKPKVPKKTNEGSLTSVKGKEPVKDKEPQLLHVA